MPHPFFRYELRTTDADAARDFYARLLGHDRAGIWPLHEQARARGARSHWLGSLRFDDVPSLEAARGALMERGADTLGPVQQGLHGDTFAVVRDRGGAIFGLATRRPGESAPAVDVGWRLLNTTDVAGAVEAARAVLGWEVAEAAVGIPGGEILEILGEAGGVMDIRGLEGRHPHWLFFFRVASVEEAVAWTRAAGGFAFEPVSGPGGRRIAVCDDPQGAAFGVME